MSYADRLARMISSSHLSLQQISMKCERIGVKVAPSYISKLQTGKQAPPSDEISTALATVCGADPEALIYDGYLEKAPEFMQALLHKFADTGRGIVKYVSTAAFPEELQKAIAAHIETLPDFDIIKQFTSTEVLQALQPTMIVKDHEDADMKLMLNPLLGTPAPDDSMAPVIPTGSMLRVESVTQPQSGDIVVVTVNDSYFIRRYIESPTGETLLVSESRNHPAVLFEPETMKILGKVTAVTTKIEEGVK